jgi:pimeloyl-ACP methyl ester carboxylesterase
MTRDWPGVFTGAKDERPEDLLSPRAMSMFLAQLIAEADLGPVHLVAPDVGTWAALFAAWRHWRPGRQKTDSCGLAGLIGYAPAGGRLVRKPVRPAK